MSNWFCKAFGLFCPKRPTKVVGECPATRLLPNKYCPLPYLQEKYYVTPKQGEPVAPTKICEVHHAPGPVYPVADHTLPRTGLDDYAGFSRTLAQQTKYLVDLVNNGGSVQRHHMLYMWGNESDFTDPLCGWRHTPYKQVGTWDDTHGGVTGTYPLFTVMDTEEYGDCWNEAKWEQYRAIWKLMAKMGVKETCSVVSFCNNKESRYYPLGNNLQHHGAETGSDDTYTRIIPNLKGDAAGTIGHGLHIHTGGTWGGLGQDRGIMPDILRLLFKKFYDELSAVPGLEWEIQVGNELMLFPDPNLEWSDQEKADQFLHDYHHNVIAYLVSLGCPTNKISISLGGPSDRARTSLKLQAEFPGLIEELHGPNSPETLTDFLNRFPGARIDGDGFDRKAEGYLNGEGYQMPSLPQCSAMRQILKDHAIPEFHIFNGYIEAGEPADITLAQWGEQRALAGKT